MTDAYRLQVVGTVSLASVEGSKDNIDYFMILRGVDIIAGEQRVGSMREKKLPIDKGLYDNLRGRRDAPGVEEPKLLLRGSLDVVVDPEPFSLETQAP